MYEYKCLTQEERDEIVVAFLQAQERDKFCHELNLERYDDMLTVLPGGKWRERVTRLRAETEGRLAEVDSIITGTEKQLPDEARMQAARERLALKG